MTALTFGSGVRDSPDFAIMWHEGLNARKARDVASSYVKFLVKNSSAAILFCGVTIAVEKNKNWTLHYTALVTAVNSDGRSESITLKC